MTYVQVTTELAKNLMVDDRLKIRLTQHNACANVPYRNPIQDTYFASLDAMIVRSRQQTNILYYEILNM